LNEVLPDTFPESENYKGIATREAFIEDVMKGIKAAPMSIRLTPHILSMINWNDPLEDPIRRQFIPMKSTFLPDHPKLTLDSLHEKEDSPAPGLVHRYPEKVLFLGRTPFILLSRLGY
jgi:lysine 2,3-aminomutase